MCCFYVKSDIFGIYSYELPNIPIFKAFALFPDQLWPLFKLCHTISGKVAETRGNRWKFMKYDLKCNISLPNNDPK